MGRCIIASTRALRELLVLADLLVATEGGATADDCNFECQSLTMPGIFVVFGALDVLIE